MFRALLVMPLLFPAVLRALPGEPARPAPSFAYEVARTHEIKPHRRTIPHEGIGQGFNQLHLKLLVSPNGDVVEANAQGDDNLLDIWPDLEPEVREWKFTPFEKDGKAVAAEVEEYIDLVPPERPPSRRVPAPALRPDSNVVITLQRSGCYGSCHSYQVTLGTDGLVRFEGGGYVVASGKHTDRLDPIEVRRLAKMFVDGNFFSMDDEYRALVTDNPTYGLSISIDGRRKSVEDYVGSWVGMPALISDLEDDVDTVARTDRWIEGNDGLVEALRAEKYNFRTFEAQVLLKSAAERGQTATVQGLLDAGVPLKPLAPPKSGESNRGIPFEHVGWLTAAAAHPDTLKALIAAGASEKDQPDKDIALVGAARSGSLDAVRALIAYGANPNADLKGKTITESAGGMTLQSEGAGGVLFYAAESGNPALLRELLRYHPDVEARDRGGKTALFAVGEYRNSDEEGARVECVRILVEAGANVNGRDNDGNTPLHEIFLTAVEEELLKLGADVNARNNDGETPIFTNVDDASLALFLAHGADLTVRNNKGETAIEAAPQRGPLRVEALRKAMETANQP